MNLENMKTINKVGKQDKNKMAGKLIWKTPKLLADVSSDMFD